MHFSYISLVWACMQTFYEWKSLQLILHPRSVVVVYAVIRNYVIAVLSADSQLADLIRVIWISVCLCYSAKETLT